MNLHIGCGPCYFENWINIEIDPNYKCDLIHDMTQPFPYESNSVDFIYSEHTIEHITVEDAVKFFKEVYRILKPGGVIRTATFDMDVFLQHHQPESIDWKEAAHWNEVGLGFIETRMESLNIAMRWWGHQYVYNVEEMIRRLREAGFSNVYSSQFNKSNYLELCNREYRPESDLIIEAVK